MDGFVSIIMIVVLFVVLYFFMIRPQKKQEKKDAEMRDSLEVGDEVTTIGGIIGKVVSIKGETFVLETTKDKTKIRFLKGAIRSVDVKAADVAAAVIEGNKDDAAPTDEKASKKKSKKADTEDAPAEASTEDENK
jgi:preprotein translocase subunit YajC